MKLPYTSPQNHQSLNLKPLLRNNTAFHSPTINTTNLCYEPTSVLDLRRSPSPVAGVPSCGIGVPALSDVLPASDDPLLQLDEWETLMHDLGLHDDSAPSFRSVPQLGPCEQQFVAEFPPSHPFDPTQFLPSDFSTLSDISLTHNLNSFLSNDFHHTRSVNDWNVVEFDFVDDLIRAAECFDSNELQLAQVILARLNQRLRSPLGKPLQRAAFYFKEALQSLLAAGSNPRTTRSSSSDIVQTIRAYKTFSVISPIAMFSNFTANQAILEAVDGSTFIHVLDFDIGLGGQWASFMKEIADRAEACKVNPSVLRITAVVPEEYAIETRLIRDNLTQFAHELKIGFSIEFVTIRDLEILSFKAIRFMDGEKTAVHLSPTIIRRIGAGFLSDLQRISPHVVVFVDYEGCTNAGATSFSRNFFDGLKFYSAMMESLDAATGGGDDWVRSIETFLMRPKIFAAVASGRRTTPFRELFSGAGMRPVPLSQFADFQAECLLRRARVRGFHVAKRQAEMLLCWHDSPLVATSAWRC